MSKLLRMGAVGLALLFGLAVAPAAMAATPAAVNASATSHASSAAAPAAVAARPASSLTPNASWYCNWWISPANQFNANCSVYSGYLRLYAQCNDGSWIYSPWDPPGNWYSWVRCGSGLYQYGFQSIG